MGACSSSGAKPLQGGGETSSNRDSNALVATRGVPAIKELTECQIEELDDKLEVFFVEIIPRTPRGSLAIEGDLVKVRRGIETGEKALASQFDAAWSAYALSKDGSEIPMIKTLRETCSALATPYGEPWPECTLERGADAKAETKALLELASRHGKSLLDGLERVVWDAGGAYYRGPQKQEARILEKAEKYGGVVATVVDVERATGVFDSLDDLNEALTKLRDETLDGIIIRRCNQSFFEDDSKNNSGYRDIKFYVEVSGTGFVGELQLNLRRVFQVQGPSHKLYEVSRVIKESPDDDKKLQRAIDGLGLQSEQVLRLKGDAALDVSALRKALESVMIPRGCTVANVYIEADDATCATMSLGVGDVGAIAKLRDDIVLDSGTFEDSLNDALRSSTKGDDSPTSPLDRSAPPPDTLGRVRIDRGAFMECYARMMMRFDKLTPHQREKLTEVRGADVAVLLAPAGGGKTFVAIHRMLQVLQEDSSAKILFAAKNEALALFACKWLVVASRKSAEHVVKRVHVLVAPFKRGPRCVDVKATGGRKMLVLGETDAHQDYALIVVEAHHLVKDSKLQRQLAAINAAASKLLFLGDASQAADKMRTPKKIARSFIGESWRV